MRLLITGLSGTLAPHLAAAAQGHGHEVIGWDRQRVPPEDLVASERRWRDAQADAVAHLATGAVDWAARLATWAAQDEVPLLFTSTAMVFHHEPDGPHSSQDPRTARDDYGRSKIASEDAVRAAHSQACVARIGWQIDADARGNNMLAHLDRQQAHDGCIRASRHWRPACSFMGDTAQALLGLIEGGISGVVHLDSNAVSGRTFDTLVHALARRFGRRHWVMESTDGYVHDQRLIGHEALMPSLDERLDFARSS